MLFELAPHFRPLPGPKPFTARSVSHWGVSNRRRPAWNEWNNLALSHVIVGIALVGTVGFLLDTLLGLVARATSYRRA